MPDLSRSVSSSPDDVPTVIALGALAATLAAVCHETLGHGLGCIGIGDHVALLTSIWFRCQGGSAITDAGGPIGNLVVGVAAFVLLTCRRVSPRAKLLLLMIGALDLFWFTAQLALGSLSNTDDWHYIALQMDWPGAWRVAGAAIGIGGYIIVIRWSSMIIRKQGGPPGHVTRLAYASAAASAVVAGLMWSPEPLKSAFEGFLALGIAPVGLLVSARRENPSGDVDASPVPRSWVWISVCTLLFVVFLFVQARGLGPMAGARLLP